jgi:hypothetical protein
MGTLVIVSQTISPFLSRLMTRLSLKGLWSTISQFAIQYLRLLSNSLVYFDCACSSVNITHPSFNPFAMSALFFLVGERNRWPGPTLKPNCLLSSLTETSCTVVGWLRSDIDSLVGVGSNATHNNLITDLFVELVLKFLVLVDFPRLINFCAHWTSCWPSLVFINPNRRSNITNGRMSKYFQQS